MTDHPILFSASMVCALLAGRKTQTRRPLSRLRCEFGSAPHDFWQHADFGKAWADPGFPDPSGRHRFGYLHVPAHAVEDCERCEAMGWGSTAHRLWPRVQAGDQLWVREAWQFAPQRFCSCLQGAEPCPCDDWQKGTGCASNRGGVVYRADAKAVFRWRSPIHMPRWASRITLAVTAVRIERLQDISEADARAEGMPITWDGRGYDPPPPEVDTWQGYARASFSLLWSKLHGPTGPAAWEKNPWVMVYSFAPEIRNIDAAPAASEAA